MNLPYLLLLMFSIAFAPVLSAQGKKDVATEERPPKKVYNEEGVEVTPHQERLYFPMLVSKDFSYSSNLFAEASSRFYNSHEMRQNYLSWFNEHYPELGKHLSMQKSAIPGTQTAITIYKVNSKFIRAILQDTSFSTRGKFPAIIDSLMLRDVFLGGDLASDITSKKTTQAEKEANTMRMLTAASKPALDPQAAKSTEGNSARQNKELKEMYVDKARHRDAIFIDQATQAPVFLEADLLAQGVGDIEDRIYEFAFRWMIFANAYPELYQNVSGKVKEYIYNNNWHALYHYCRENLNPSSYRDEVNYLLNSNNL
ncbi:MAG: hypothetical protein R2850_06520 [Bacteroidia bacterium]